MCYKWNCSLFLSGTLPRLVSVKITYKYYSSVYSMTTFISVMDMKEFIHFQYQILQIYFQHLHTIKNCLQWNPSNADTNGAEESVLYREVSLFQGLKCMQEWYLGRQKVSLLERCPQFRGVLIEGFHCIKSSSITQW